MIAVNYSQLLQLALPETIVVVTAFVVLGADLLFLRPAPLRVRFNAGAWTATVGCVVAIAYLLRFPLQANFLQGALLAGPLIQMAQVALLVLTALVLLLSTVSTFTEHVGEFLALVLMATVGMMFLVATQDLLVIFLSLELLSLSLYILTALDKRNARSSEAALKYFLFGGVSAAFLLFGFSLLYGLTNTTSLARMPGVLHGPGLDPLLMVALVTTVIGFGFKVAAAPFHFWAPDVYQGAPAPSAGLIASSSKVASFFVFFQVMVVAFAGVIGSASWRHFSPGWAPVMALVAVASMLLGNLAALVQSSVRRLLAYSAVAHAGYMLLGILAHTQQGLASLLYYVFTYALATLGAFGVVAVVERRTGGDTFKDFEGLSRLAPVESFCLLIYMLSLAGIPPLAGFFGKFYLFASVVGSAPDHLGLLWLVALAIAMSAVSLYYYLQVLKRAFVANVPEGARPAQTPLLGRAVLVLLALTIVLLGCAPHWLMGHLQQAIAAPGL